MFDIWALKPGVLHFSQQGQAVDRWLCPASVAARSRGISHPQCPSLICIISIASNTEALEHKSLSFLFLVMNDSLR